MKKRLLNLLIALMIAEGLATAERVDELFVAAAGV